MICHRSSKHSIGKNVTLLAREIQDNTMMIPPGPQFTNFIQKGIVYCFSTEYITKYPQKDVKNLDFEVPPSSTVFTIVQDFLT
jgi:hypothetical protein